MSEIASLSNFQCKSWTESKKADGTRFLAFSAANRKNEIFNFKCWENEPCYENLKRILRNGDVYSFTCEIIQRPYDCIDQKSGKEITVKLTEYKVIRFEWNGARRTGDDKSNSNTSTKVNPANNANGFPTQHVSGFGM